MVWCVEEAENFTAWCRNARRINDDYEKRRSFMEAMIKELDRAYGETALSAGIYAGIEEFCKHFDIDDALKKKAEELYRR